MCFYNNDFDMQLYRAEGVPWGAINQDAIRMNLTEIYADSTFVVGLLGIL